MTAYGYSKYNHNARLQKILKIIFAHVLLKGQFDLPGWLELDLWADSDDDERVEKV